MHILEGVAVSLLAGFVGFLLGWAWRRLRNAALLRRARKFWAPFLASESLVVVGRLSLFKGFEQSGFVGFGDAMALGELKALFEKLGSHHFNVAYAGKLVGDATKRNLVLIGGPDANPVSREAVTRIGSNLRFGDPKRHEIAIYDTHDGRCYAPIVEKDSHRVIADFGVILKTANPFDPSHQLLLIAGSFGYGTWAGMRFATTKHFLESPIVVDGSSIECLIQTDVAFDTPQRARLIILRQLQESSQPPARDSKTH